MGIAVKIGRFEIEKSNLPLVGPCMLCPDLRSCQSVQVADNDVMLHRCLLSYCDRLELFSDACGATARLLGALQRQD